VQDRLPEVIDRLGMPPRLLGDGPEEPERFAVEAIQPDDLMTKRLRLRQIAGAVQVEGAGQGVGWGGHHRFVSPCRKGTKKFSVLPWFRKRSGFLRHHAIALGPAQKSVTFAFTITPL
jgi:hypothetical protein